MAKIVVVENELENKQEKNVVVPRSAAEIQRFKLEKLLKKSDKPVFVPEKKDPKLPRVFNPPEFIRNIWGSSAGAGSGDFHVYRGVRRRENARQKYLNQKYKKDELDEEFQKRLAEHKEAAVTRTDKKRAKRLKKKQKAKEAKKKKVTKKPDTSDGDGKDEESECDEDNSDINAGDADSDSNVAVHADSEAADTAVANNDSVDDDSSSVIKCTQQTDSVSHSNSW